MKYLFPIPSKNILLFSVFFIIISGCSEDSIPLSKVDFSSNRTNLISGNQVSFQDRTSGDSSEWNWTFEGGTPEISTEQNPVVTYNESGSYNVTLTTSTDGNSETITKDNFINVFNVFDESNLPNATPCKLEKIFTYDFVDLGFPNNGLLPSLGDINVHVLFADFPDVQASMNTDEVFQLLDPVVVEFFDEMSYGRMNVNLIPYSSWLRMSMPASHYANGLSSGSGHRDFIQEAVDLSDSQVDFSNADIVVVMSNPNAEEIGYGPAFGSFDESFAIQADGNSILTGITSGYDLNFWGGIWLAHEMGHSLGLPDLYSYSNSDIHRYAGDFGIMGHISAQAPGFFAYERWLLGWLDDSQIYCHSSGTIAVELEQLGSEGGLKSLLVPLSYTESIVIESRRRTGFDSSMPKEGVLVYVVDTSAERGGGPINVKPNAKSGSMKQNAPMITGNIYTYQNVTIEVIESRPSSDIVLVNIN